MQLPTLAKADGIPHDRTSFRAPKRFHETGGLESGNEAGVDERVGHPALLGLDRISLNDPGSLLASIGDRGLGQLSGHSLASVRFGDKKTGDRPDWLGINTRQDPGILQQRV